MAKKNNQTIALNTKVFFRGGQTYIPLLTDDQGNLDVDPENNKYWDYEKAYDNKFDNMYQINLSASYNLTGPEPPTKYLLIYRILPIYLGKISEYYDESEPNSVGYRTQFGFFRNLMYRVYF